MRGVTDEERAELLVLSGPDSSEGEFFTLDELEVCRRVEQFDLDPFDGSYRIRVTELGRLALRLPRL